MNTPTSSQKILAAAISLALSSASQAANYVYDDLNRLTLVRYESGQVLHYSYDAAGNLLRITTVVPKYTITGRVTGLLGDPLPGVIIAVDGQQAETNARGYYRLTEIKAGNYTLVANHDKYAFNTFDITIGKNHPSVHNIVSLSEALYTIEGHVTDKNGQPLFGVLIEAGEHTARTDENGYYQLTDLLANKYTVIAQLAPHNFTPRKITVGFKKPTVINLVSDGLTACLLYAVHDDKKKDTQFFTVNPATPAFEVKLLGQLHLGKDIEALDIHPDTSQIFAAAGDDGKYPGHLYQVNAITGSLYRLGGTPQFSEINGLSFKPDGSLWGWAETAGLIQMDTQTGQGTLTLAYDGPIEDITWDNQGLMLYGIEQNQLLAYNSQTDQLAEVGCHLPGGEVEALEMLPDGRLLFSSHEDETLSIHALDVTSCELIGVDISTETVGMQLNDVEGIAWPIGACEP